MRAKGSAHKSVSTGMHRTSVVPRPEEYAAFDQLNGEHPWKEAVPEGFISYPVRQLRFGSIAYFNFDLAKEMGLIPKDHPHRMNKRLERKLLETFNIRIINEYDQQNNILYPGSTIKPNEFMATRYLQLQHPDKRGLSSGDGRCVWNGHVQYKGKHWDVSSRGTGVTCLAPGYVEAGRPLKSGNTDFGYGCGLAEIDELYASAIMAEIFHNNQIHTERMLAIVDTGKGVGIGVRAAPNLVRPAHLFLYLKQNNWDALSRATDYLIQRQFENKEWSIRPHQKDRYDLLLKEVCETFAQFVAQLDREYIFAWLDWDGDNVLANAGIIDYGSVRQFGLRHDQYRYDDVDRFSTTLNQQRTKARLTIQVFAQMVDFLKTKTRKPLPHFKRHPILKEFDKHFKYYELDHFLYQLGFERPQRETLLKSHKSQVEDFFNNFSYFERVKTYRKMQKVADGINRPAIFNMRNWARELPQFLANQTREFDHVTMDPKEAFQLILASSASRKDSKMPDRLKKRLLRLQIQYKNLIKRGHSSGNLKKALSQMAERSQLINREDRITGNGLLNVVYEILKFKSKGLAYSEIQKVVDQFITSQFLRPEMAKSQGESRLHRNSASYQLIQNMFSLVDGYKEDI